MRTVTQRLALIFGVVFLVVGVAGLLVPGGIEMDAESPGLLLGLFPVNVLHNIVHIAFGVWGMAASRSLGGTRTFGKTGAVIYVLLVIIAFIDPTTFGLVPIGGHDIWLHAVLAAGLAFIGFGGSADI